MPDPTEFTPSIITRVPAWAWVLCATGVLAGSGACLVLAKPVVRERALEPYAYTHQIAANALRQLGRSEDALAQFQKALAADPSMVPALNNMANIFFEQGRMEEAVAYYKMSLNLKPNEPASLTNYGNALASMSRFPEALTTLRQALAIEPENVQAMISVAWILAVAEDGQIRQPTQALELAEKALAASDEHNVAALRSLAAAYAANHRFPDATAIAEKARDLCITFGDAAAAQQMQIHMATYRAGEELRVPTASATTQTP